MNGRFLPVAALLAVGLGPPWPQQARDSDPTRELTQIEQQLATTWKNHDCAAWAAILAPDWSVIHVTATVITRAEAVQMCEARAARIDTLSIDELSVRVYGDAAVVTGRTIATAAGTPPETVRLRFTDVFVRHDGRWRAVASQATRIVP